MLSREEATRFMRRAIALSEEAVENKQGGPFGALVVRNGKIIGEGNNSVTTSIDPTAHAEVNAIRDACQQAGTFDLSDAWIFTSCEPCPMCLGAIYWARLRGVYFANSRYDAAKIGFDDEFFYSELDKAINERTIPFIELLGEEAKGAFEAWEKLEDKTEY